MLHSRKRFKPSYKLDSHNALKHPEVEVQGIKYVFIVYDCIN